MFSNPQDYIKGSVRLSSLPQIYFKINDVINDPESSFGDVAKIISNDTSLSLRLLKIVNSSFYNFPSEIDTISHAISIVGTAQLRDLALATMVLTAFGDFPEEFINMESFWKHSVGCGVAAWVIALNCSEANPERYYLTGILHDVGRLILFENHPEKARKIMERCHAESKIAYQVEREVLGFDHGQIGAALLAEWRLPPNLGDVVKNHHSPLEATEYFKEVAILNLADLITKSMELGSTGDVLIPPLAPEIWEKIGMQVDSLPLLWQQIQNQYDETIEIFLPE
ncbi:MAG: HDOD domain-containing protein [Nitrospinae bacterium]|nr:HDOD domain-containing protein [Nitrospinota bacterium]MDA1110650.1 HDOD domain-containing protein [Nitrospinota bacterium]